MRKLLVSLLVFVALVACAKKDDSKVLVTIDDDKITLEEFNKALDKIPMNMKMVVATQSGKKSYLDNLIIKKLLMREATKEKVENEKEFQERLADIKEQLILESLVKKKVNQAAQVPDADLKAYYDSHKEEFKKEREISTRHILLKTDEEAKQVQGRLAKGEDFVDLARRYSIDPNAKASGGEIGYHPKGTLLPEYEEAAFKLTKVGQISGIVKTQFGYHIIRLEGAKPPSYVPFEEVKDFIKQRLGQEKQKQVFDKYIEDLRKNAKIQINEGLLKDEKSEKTDQQAKPVEPEKKDAPPTPSK